ncbi:MAG TPA: hypothetical protein VGS57_16535 [Thermoanaerobaculia bacterium]|nr:hypothetical protein [Thermoanaerobaculia bacterium]
MHHFVRTRPARDGVKRETSLSGKTIEVSRGDDTLCRAVLADEEDGAHGVHGRREALGGAAPKPKSISALATSRRRAYRACPAGDRVASGAQLMSTFAQSPRGGWKTPSSMVTR